MHLVMNLFGVILAGYILEPIVKTWRFLSIFVLSGLAASLANAVFYEYRISVGASGAVFGLFAVALVLNLGKIYLEENRLYYGIAIALFLGLNVIVALSGFANNIGHVAHITGFLTGLVLGLGLLMTQRQFLLKNALEQHV